MRISLKYIALTTVIGCVLATAASALVTALGVSHVRGGQDLLVSSAGTNQVLHYDGKKGDFKSVFAFEGGLSFPHGLIIGPDENLYVSSSSTDNVLRYDGVSGDFIDEFVTAGKGGLSGPRGLVFGPDGNLYVASFSTDSVFRYDGTTGDSIDQFVTPQSGGLMSPQGLDFGPDGNLYVASQNTSQVLRYDGATGDFIDVFASGGGLTTPRDFDFGADGNLYVGSLSNEILRYDGGTGDFIDVFASGGGLSAPTGVLFGPDGNLYVGSQNTDNVLRYDGTTGDFIDEFVTSGSGGLDLPTFLTFFPEPAVMADLDIKPGSCPNAFNRGSRGVLPVALVGTDSFDVMEVDLTTVLLSRADGLGGTVAPHEGPPGPHSVFEDVATPFDGELCDCHELKGDGILDLSMKFRTDEVVAALELDDFQRGDLVELVVTGNLLDGTEFEAGDCILIIQ